jgi:hypothetical protein
MADTTIQQIQNMAVQIANLQALIAGVSNPGKLYPVLGNLVAYGCYVSNELYPATAITSSSVASSTVITTSVAHNLTTGQYVEILGHSGSTPSLNGYQGPVTVLTTTTFSIPVTVTVGGSGGTVRAITMQLSLNGQNANDTGHLNPNGTSPPLRIENYYNSGFIYGQAWFRDNVNVGTLTDATWPITTAPGTGYHRYDIVYAYNAVTGPTIGVATGTAVLNASTPTQPPVPQGAIALAQVHVQAGVQGIVSTAITDLRNFTGRLQWAAVTPVVTGITTASTITPTANTCTQYDVSALASSATIAIPTGGQVDGQKLLLRIKDNGTAQTLTWTTTAGGYRVKGVTLPTTTTASTVSYVGCIYNAQDGYWDVIAVG